MSRLSELIREVPIRLTDGGPIKAFGEIVLGDLVKISFKIMQNRSTGELFCSLPGYKNKEGNWQREVMMTSKDLQTELNEIVMKAFNEAKENTQPEGDKPGCPF